MIIAAVQAGGPLTILAVITMLNAAVAAFYYLRVVVYMWMRDAPENAPPVRVGGTTQAGLVLAALVTVFFWAPPFTTVIIDLAREAASALR